MTKKTAGILWWIAALVFTISLAVYQRITGPTYPVTGNVEIAGRTISYKLPRSNNSDREAKITITNAPESMEAIVTYKRFKVSESNREVKFSRDGDLLTAYLPPEPPAGKLEYKVVLYASDAPYVITQQPVVIRFKGPVPAVILIPHIFFMFLAMWFSTRTGIEALIKGNRIRNYSGLTLIFLVLGGMLLGPAVQKYAFGAFWTGWPFGHDLTDNKTLVAVIGWLIAWLRVRKNPNRRGWAIAAALILLAVYLIPHSMFGSELDYSTGEVETGQ